MSTGTVSTRGQIAIPKEVRNTLNIKVGDHLNFKIEGDKIIMEPTVTFNIPRSQIYSLKKDITIEEIFKMQATSKAFSEWTAPENDIYDEVFKDEIK